MHVCIYPIYIYLNAFSLNCESSNLQITMLLRDMRDKSKLLLANKYI